MPRLIKQLHQIKAATLQVRPAEFDRVTISRTATQTLNHVWGSLELIFHEPQFPALCQSDRRTVLYEHMKNSTMEGQSNSIARVAFNLISMKQVQLRINMAQKHERGGGGEGKGTGHPELIWLQEERK